RIDARLVRNRRPFGVGTGGRTTARSAEIGFPPARPALQLPHAPASTVVRRGPVALSVQLDRRGWQHGPLPRRRLRAHAAHGAWEPLVEFPLSPDDRAAVGELPVRGLRPSG